MGESVDIKTSIIIISYNHSTLLERCLQSIFLFEDVSDKEIIVVDNQSSDLGIKELSKKYSTVKFVFSSRNLGFGKANNLAAFNYAQGRYLLFVNQDICFVEPVIHKLIGCLHSRPLVQLVGPRLQSPGGQLQYSTHGYPTILKEWIRLWPSIQFIMKNSDFFRKFLTTTQKLLQSNLLARYDGHATEVKEVKEITGACFLMEKQVFQNYDGFDPNYFMYQEEADLCFRIIKNGNKILFNPLLSIQHELHGTQVGMPTPEALLLYKERCYSLLYFTHKNFGTLKAITMRVVLGITLFLRILFGCPLSLFFSKNKVILKRDIIFFTVCLSKMNRCGTT